MRLTPVRFGQAVPVAEIPQWLRSLRATKAYDRKLTHVTSERLCDDVLQFLKPSLPPPHTCDVIELNPGPCLWTQKLNSLLKPRRHVLVEPYYDGFAKFIDPLLREPNSSYRYAPDMKIALDPKKQLLSHDTYQFRRDVTKSQERKVTMNENLLITANLSGIARKVVGFTGSQAKQFLNDYYRAIFVNDEYIHRYGLVRLLAWVDRDARKSIMPTSVNARTKQSVQLETAFTVTQVASPSPFEDLYAHQKRWYDLEAENQLAVRKLEKKTHLIIPSNRKQPEPVLPFTALDPKIEVVREHKNLYPHNQVYIQRVLDLDNKLSTDQPEWYAKYQQEIDNNFKYSKQDAKRNPEPTRKAYRLLMTQLRTHHNTFLKSKTFIWERRQLFKKFLTAWTRGWFSPKTGMPADGPHEKEAEELIKADAFMYQEVSKIKKDTRSLILKAGDDYHCYDTDHKTLAWNQRLHDPLLVKDNEFYPKASLSLLSLTPITSFPSQIDTVDRQICFDYVCTLLMTSPGDTVLQGIKRLVPAGYDQFLERVPELRDISRGGWWNLEHVRVRALPTDFFIKIALAFHDWPHRPDISKLIAVYKGVFDDGPR